MKRFAIKLLTNLKVSSVETVQAGTLFEGAVSDLPDYIQSMVREQSRSIVIRELPEEVILPEVPEVPVEVPEPEVAKPSPRKTSRKPIKQ